jgi:hypothetical protein
MAMSMGNKLPAEVMTQYNNQKSGIAAPVAPAAPAAPASPTPPDLLQSKISTSNTYTIGGEPVVAGVPLSSVQMAAIEMSLSMGNKLPAEVMTQYNKQKSGTTAPVASVAQVSPPAAVAAAPPAVTPPDLLQSKISAPITYSVGGEKVIPGAALSSNQMTAIEMSLLMGSKPPAEIMAQYNKQKSSRVASTTTAPDLLESKISPPAALSAENAAAVTGAAPSSALMMNIADTTIAAQQGRMSMIEQTEASRSGSPTIIVNAPTVAPVNNNVTGPTNISNQRVTSIGTGSGGSGLARFAN